MLLCANSPSPSCCALGGISQIDHKSFFYNLRARRTQMSLWCATRDDDLVERDKKRTVLPERRRHLRMRLYSSFP